MNKKSFILSLIFVFVLSMSALADVHHFPKFIVTVPDGWTVSEEAPTVTIMANDKSAALTVTMTENDGTALKDIAYAYSQQLKGTKPEIDEDGIYYFTFNNPSGVVCQTIVCGDKSEYIMLVMIGEHPQMEAIIDSIEEK